MRISGGRIHTFLQKKWTPKENTTKDTKSTKAVEEIKGIHEEAQLLTIMKLAGIKTGLLIHFNVTKLKNDIKRYVL